MPIVKSEVESDGRLRVWGLASDQRKDMDGEVIDASANPSCLHYGFTKFDLNHNSVLKDGPVIGDVTALRILKNADARKKYPHLKIEGDPVEVEGFVYRLGTRPTKDLELVHHYHEVGAGLGFSLFGDRAGAPQWKRVNGELVPVTIPKSVTTIAITPQPKNDGSACFIAKSMSAVLMGQNAELDQFGFESAVFDPLCPRFVVSDSSFFKSQTADAPAGANASAGAGGGAFTASPLVLPLSGAQGGDALKVAGLSKRPCTCCGERLIKGARFCVHCGVKSPFVARDEDDDEDEIATPDTGELKGKRAIVKALLAHILAR